MTTLNEFTLNKTGRDHLAALRRRSAFLAGRIADYHGANPSRDIAEHSALDWAIRFIEATMPKPEDLTVAVAPKFYEVRRAATP